MPSEASEKTDADIIIPTAVADEKARTVWEFSFKKWTGIAPSPVASALKMPVRAVQNIKVIYNKENIENTIGEVLESAGKKQIRIAETEKYPHVTFFFSGGREEAFKGEKRLLCPSLKVATYDLKPEMSAF